MNNEWIIQKKAIFTRTSAFLYTEKYLYNKGGALPVHRHEFFEIGITLDGHALHTTKDRKEKLSAGTVYMIPIGSEHAILDFDAWSVRNIYLLPAVLFAYLPKMDSSAYLKLQNFLMKYGGNHSDVISFTLTEKSLKAIKGILNTLDISLFSDEDTYEIYQRHCILNILLLLAEDFYQQNSQETVYVDPRVIQIAHYIQAHLELPLKQILQTLSQNLALDPQYINRIVKKNMGIPISRYVTQCKIEKSIELLMGGAAPTDVAVLLGYYDYSHFHKYFTEYVGKSPGSYREMNHRI